MSRNYQGNVLYFIVSLDNWPLVNIEQLPEQAAVWYWQAIKSIANSRVTVCQPQTHLRSFVITGAVGRRVFSFIKPDESENVYLVIRNTVSHQSSRLIKPATGFNPRLRQVQCGYGCTSLVVVLRLPQGMLNRGAICVRMHLSSCTDVKEPWWPSEILEVQKQTDGAGIGDDRVLILFAAKGERCK